MTREERIAIIKNRASRNHQEQVDKELATANRRKDLMKQVEELADRIQDIIALANSCTENGIEIPRNNSFGSDRNAGKQYGYPCEFIAEGVFHHTGLIQTWGMCDEGTFEYLGIENGGVCGKYDFWTNGYRSFGKHEDNHAETEPRICDLEKFLSEFPVFESAFLKWIDSLAD